MGDEAPLKSAYELAMERLRAEDSEHGVAPVRSLSEEQKAAIADARTAVTSKLAELEILFAKHLAAAGGDPSQIAELETNYAIDRERAESSLESKIARIRNDTT